MSRDNVSRHLIAILVELERVGWLQIDTLQVVRRAQYLTLWSRLGSYDPAHLDRLLFGGGAALDNGRRLFEYWMHAACIIPLAHYGLARLADGATHELVVHRDNLPLLQRAADGDLRPRRTTFLSPFDSLFWANGRDLQLWRFRQVLECYKPQPRREWGYFCLPILDRDRLVGRLHPKLERATGLLRLKKLYLEPGVRPSARLAASTARALRDFMRFHGAGDLAVEHSDPPDLAAKLTASL